MTQGQIDRVAAFGDDPSVEDDDRADGHVAGPFCIQRELAGAAQEPVLARPERSAPWPATSQVPGDPPRAAQGPRPVGRRFPAH
jgi:hypothetical protein